MEGEDFNRKVVALYREHGRVEDVRIEMGVGRDAVIQALHDTRELPRWRGESLVPAMEELREKEPDITLTEMARRLGVSRKTLWQHRTRIGNDMEGRKSA